MFSSYGLQQTQVKRSKIQEVDISQPCGIFLLCSNTKCASGRQSCRQVILPKPHGEKTVRIKTCEASFWSTERSLKTDLAARSHLIAWAAFVFVFSSAPNGFGTHQATWSENWRNWRDPRHVSNACSRTGCGEISLTLAFAARFFLLLNLMKTGRATDPLNFQVFQTLLQNRFVDDYLLR